MYLPFGDVAPEPRPPQDYLNIPTTPREFGAGIAEGEQRLGAGATHAGEIFGQIASDDQANYVLTGLDDLNTKFRELQGRDRMDQYPVVRQKMDELFRQARGNLTTASQQVNFDRQTRYLYSHALREAGDLYDAAQKDWGVGVNRSGAELSLNGISKATVAGDQAAIDAHTQDLMNFRMKEKELRYGGNLDPTIRDETLSAARSEATLRQATGLLAVDPDRAKAFISTPENQAMLGAHAVTLQREAETLAHKGNVQKLLGEAGRLGGGPSSAPLGPPPSGPVEPTKFTEEAGRQGVSPALVHATASIESSYGTNTGNKISPSNTGIFQRAPANAPGGMNDSYDNQIRLGVGDLAREREDLRGKIGREPTNAEVYLAHQQGAGGAAWLLTHPNEPAGNVPGGPGDAPGSVRISNNGGDPNAPASQFVAHWRDQYNHVEARFAGLPAAAGAQPIPPGTQPAGEDWRAKYGQAADSLMEGLDRIQNAPFGTDADKAAAAQQFETRWRARIADAARLEAMQAKEQKEREAAAADPIVKQLILDPTKVDPHQIADNPAFNGNPHLRWQLNEMQMRALTQDKEKITDISRVETTHLLERMRLPADDPQRIADSGPLFDSFIQNRLTPHDLDWLLKKQADVQSPDGERLAAEDKKFTERYKSLITQPNPLLGKHDPIGDANYYMFEWWKDQKIIDYKRKGLNPLDLFRPTSPDFLGKPENIQQFQGTYQDWQRRMTEGLTSPSKPPSFPAGVSLPGAPVVAAPPKAVPRLPGESMPDYVSRTGALGMPPNVRQAPGAPPPAAPAPTAAPAIAPPIR